MRPRQAARILEEERLRARLSRPADEPNPLIKFLNSAFGLWLLTSVVLSALTWSYSQWKVSADNDEQIYKLDVEISERLESGWSYRPTDGKPYFPVNHLLFPPGPEAAIQPEFANRNLKSLLYELESRLPVGEQLEVMLALDRIKAWEEHDLNKSFSDEEDAAFRDEALRLYRTRWRSGNMSARYMAIYNRPGTLIFRFMIGFGLLWLVFGGYWSVQLAINKFRKLRKRKTLRRN